VASGAAAAVAVANASAALQLLLAKQMSQLQCRSLRR